MSAASASPLLEKDIIAECLKYHNYETAISLAELRHAYEKSERSGLELAEAFVGGGDKASALALLETLGPSSPSGRLLFARLAADADRDADAEAALLSLLAPSSAPSASSEREPSSSHNQDPAFTAVAPHAHFLLGRIYYRTNRVEKAKREWKRALELCPYLWPAYRSLSEAGEAENLDPSDVFTLPRCHGTNGGHGALVPEVKLETPAYDKGAIRSLIIETPNQPSPLLVPLNMDSPMDVQTVNTPSNPLSLPMQGLPFSSDSVPPVAPKKDRTKQTRKLLSGSGMMTRRSGRRGTADPADENASNRTRRSPRLANGGGGGGLALSGAANNENTSSQPSRSARSSGLRYSNSGGGGGGDRSRDRGDKSSTTRGRPAGSNRIITPSPTPTEELDAKDKEALLGPFDPLEHQAAIYLSLRSPQPPAEPRLLQSLQALGRVWQELGSLRWLPARHEIQRLPPTIRNAPSVLVEEARTYFEVADYRRAVEIFSEVRRRAPWHVAGLELYSTALWHLQSAAELSALAQSLLPAFRNRTETWCVMGNAFSLHKDHEKAIRFLQRAIQLQPLPYAFTLLGHEHLALDAADKASQAFRTALRLQPRHYNAWFGLGEAAKRGEQLKLARLHFQRALAINPNNPILQCQMAEMEQALGRPREALAWLSKSPTASNPICRYHRAQLLFATGKANEALEVQCDQFRLNDVDRVFRP